MTSIYDDSWDTQAEDEADEYSLNGEPLPEPLPEYTNPAFIWFVRDAQAAGLKVEHYVGRYFWEGPAVRVDDLQDGIRATTQPVQWDNMGLGWIVYPKARGS